ncbi:hypothetical protein C1645_836310 [Glomus cerebriforme]|uniref:Uncharacterized protein n=1 Tax=Glomus cerebriforme TaxID=658196 RepID=A0A397S8N0_9GLOM|nr:hypothetical protein C1645_836310 [Glomus cerebriforme]
METDNNIRVLWKINTESPSETTKNKCKVVMTKIADISKSLLSQDEEIHDNEQEKIEQNEDYGKNNEINIKNNENDKQNIEDNSKEKYDMSPITPSAK